IARRGHIDLTRFYDDYIGGGAMPKLTLANVRFEREAGAWRVSGVLRNDGSGEALAPVALRTSRGTMWQTLRAGTGTHVPFVFITTDDPRSVQLDPDQVCFRWAAIGTVEAVDYRGRS